MKRFRGVLAFLTLALAVWTPGLAHAQGLSGQIGGSVVDNSKGAVPGATVTVRNTATAVTRDVVTDSEGLFVFTNLFAGTYDLRVTLTGFRTYEQKGLVLSATERLALAPITLDVGGLEEVVTVEASALHAQAQSGERSGTIRAEEIKDTQLRGRDFLGLLQGMPGVVDTNVRNAPGWNAFLGTQINGLSDQMMGMSYDGVSSKDTGFGAANYVTPSLDSIAEVKDSDVELPGRIRPGRWRQHHRRDQERQLAVQRIGGLLQAARSPDRELLGPAAHLRRHRRHLTAVREAALPVRQLGVHAGRAGAPAGHGVQREPRQAVLLLLARPAAAHRSVPGEQHDAVGAGTQRRLLADAKQRRRSCGSSAIRSAGWRATSTPGGPGCFPGNVIPQGMIHPMGRQMLNLFPLPDPGAGGQSRDAGQLQLSVRRRYGEAAPRQRRPRRLEHPAGHDVLHPVADGQGSVRPRPVQRDRTGADCRRRHGVPVVGGQLRHQHQGLRGQPHAHLLQLDGARNHRRQQLGGAGRVPAGADRLGCARLSESPARAPAVLPGEQPEPHPAGHDVHARGAAPTPYRTRGTSTSARARASRGWRPTTRTTSR